MAGARRFSAYAVVLCLLLALAGRAAGASPAPATASGSSPSASAGGATGAERANVATPTGSVIQPSDESADLTRIVLLGLVGFVVLILIPTQVAKGIAARRARPPEPPTPLRRPTRTR